MRKRDAGPENGDCQGGAEMRQKERARQMNLGRDVVFAQVKQMAEELDAEQFFARLEGLIDQLRVDLDMVPDPKFREELRDLFREVIDYALGLKLEDVFAQRAAQG
jgi:hypothetical protein